MAIRLPAGHVFIATSLDGFIARRDGAIDWLPLEPGPGEDWGYERFMAGIDGLVMGRGSFEVVAAMPDWPYPKPVVVLSRTVDPSSLPPRLAGKVEIINATPREIMKMLGDRGWTNVYVDGGKVIQSFLREGLIDDMVISRIPVLLGDGLPLFGGLDRDVRLKHVETQSFASGLVQSRYQVIDRDTDTRG